MWLKKAVKNKIWILCSKRVVMYYSYWYDKIIIAWKKKYIWFSESLKAQFFLGRITAFNLTQSLSYLVLLKAEGLYIRKTSQLGTLRTCFAGKSSFMCFVIGISLINSVFFQKSFDFVPNLCNELLLGNYCRHSPTKVSLIIMSPEPYIIRFQILNVPGVAKTNPIGLSRHIIWGTV